jgi:hypothetical protein
MDLKLIFRDNNLYDSRVFKLESDLHAEAMIFEREVGWFVE